MKKFLIVLTMFAILLATQNIKNDFTLLDYFSGEYIAYTQTANEFATNLGFCYMQTNKVDAKSLIGESLKIENFEPVSALKTLNANIIKTEYIEGRIVIYAYSPFINKDVIIDNQKVNLQIAQTDEYTILGWPLILGSF